MRGSLTTRPAIAITAAAAVLLAFALSACNPSKLEVEHNIAKSFARKLDQVKELKSSCTIVGSDTEQGSYLSECSVSGANGYRAIVRVSTDYQAGTFSARDPYQRSLGGTLKRVDGVWTYAWAV
jgi:hypothetical protein